MFAASKSGRAVSGATTDPYFPYVPLLLNTTSTNGQQNNTFLDSSSNAFTITRNGTPTQGAFTPYRPSGYWSGYFNGSSDYLSIADSAAFTIGTNSLTIEAWIYPASLPSSGSIANIAAQWVATASNQAWLFALYNNAGALQLLWQPTSGTTQTVISQNYAFAVNSWYHVAVVKNGTAVTLYVNGTALGAATTYSSSVNDSAANLTIGIRGSLDLPFAGYISNFRFVNGTAVYTANFTPPTSPLTAITNTSLLTLQSNRFIDNSSNAFAITAAGTPKVQAFQPFAPAASYSAATYGGSGYFGGTSDYLTIPITASGPLDISTTTTYTIEAWVYWTASAGNKDVWSWEGKQTGGASAYYQLYWATSGNVLKWEQSNTSGVLTVVTTSLTPALNTWYHIAIVRSGSAITVYANGQSVGSGTYAPNDQQFVEFALGSLFFNTGYIQFFSGYISNFRFVKGTPVYTGAFTPPTLAPLTTAGSTSAASYTSTTNVNTSFAAANTSLLANFTNAGIYDTAWQNNALTVGDAQVSTTQYKWSPTSMKFDGTGDWLTAIDSPGLQLGSGDFTIEGWVYLSATGVAYGLISKGTASTGWSVNVTSGNKLQFSYTASNLTGATSLSASTWYYFAVVRSGTATGNLKVYLNGSADATSSGAVTDNFNQTSTLYTGADRIGGSALNGYLQDIRLTKGYARTITTPTAAFPTR